MTETTTKRKRKQDTKKPPIKPAPRWSKQKKKEIEGLVIKLAKERYNSAFIGIVLRDRYGVPDVKKITGKNITQIMIENKVYPDIPEDLLNLLKKAVNLKGHLEKHKQDKHSKKGLEDIESRIRKLGKYYSRKKTLPKDWRYSYEEAKLIVQK